MKTDEPQPAGETPGPFTISASQLSTYADCPRKWAYDKLDGVPRGDTAATNEGKLIHGQVEAYYKEGTVPARPEARAALTHMPPREQPGLKSEMPFEFVWPGLDALAHGFIDLVDFRYRAVHDLKTVGNLKRSLKTEEDLRYDAQAVLYSTALRVLTQSMDPVTLQWTYVVREQPKTRAPKTEPVRLVHTAEDAEVGLAKWTPVAAAILKLRKAGGRALDVLPNTDACVKYGPCQYRDLCPDYTGHAKKPSKEEPMAPELVARLASLSGAPMVVRTETEAEAARAPTDEITQDPNRPQPPKMALLDTLRIDLGATPAIVPPDAQPNVSPVDPPLPVVEPVVEKPKRGRKPKAALDVGQVETVLLPLVQPGAQEEVVEHCCGYTAKTQTPKELDKVVEECHDAVLAQKEFVSQSTPVRAPDVKFVYEAPTSLDVRANDFDLDAFVESVCEKAAKSDELEVQLQAARIAVDLLAVRKQ